MLFFASFYLPPAQTCCSILGTQTEHGAHDQQVGVGDRYCALGVDALTEVIQLIGTVLCPTDGILLIQVDRCHIPVAFL